MIAGEENCMDHAKPDVTIYDIAAQAGVSVATVSRVINHFDQVSYSTRRRVLAVMESLGFDLDYYRKTAPKRGSLSKKQKKTEKEQLFLLSVPSLTNIFFTDIIDGAESSARKNGHHLLVDNTSISQENIASYCAFLRKHHISGIITTAMLSTAVLKQLQETIPVVQCSEYNSEVRDISSVSIDDAAAAYHAAKFLLEKAGPKLAYFTPTLNHQFAVRRKRGFLRAMAESGIAVNHGWILELSHRQIDRAINEIEQWLSANHPDAIFCGSDFLAGAALKAAWNLHLRIPDDVSVMGFDDISMATGSLISISTVQQPRYSLGYHAFELLWQEVQDPSIPKKQLVLPTKMIFRESTAFLSESV